MKFILQVCIQSSGCIGNVLKEVLQECISESSIILKFPFLYLFVLDDVLQPWEGTGKDTDGRLQGCNAMFM